MVLLHLVALLIGGAGAPDFGDPGPVRARVSPRVAEPAGEVATSRASDSTGVAVSWAADSTGVAVLLAADSTGVAVLVHERGGAEELEPSQIRRIFLLRQRFWSDGSPVAPVNLPASSPLRDEFSRLALGQSTRALAEYWKDLSFHGTQPPAVLDSEEAVFLYVERTAGGIGYVSLSFLRGVSLPPEVRVARVFGEGRLR